MGCFLAAAVFAAGLSACSTRPRVPEPALPLPSRFSAPAPAAGSARSEAAWVLFSDPVLHALIREALAHNRDAAQARARIDEARARFGVAEAGRFPTLGLRAGATRSRSSEAMGLGSAGGRISVTWQAGLDASWELDLFGGKKGAVEAAQASLEAASADLDDVRSSLTAELASSYLDARAYAARLEIAEANARAQEDIVDLVSWRKQAGLASEIEVAQAVAAAAQTRAQIPTLRLGLAQAKNRIAVLIGQTPETFDLPPGELPEVLTAPLVDFPAEVLRRRPDVRRAERQLVAALAQIGVAEAALWPSVSLTGSLGLSAAQSGELFTRGAQVYSLAAQALATLFDTRLKRQNVAVQRALAEQARARYENTLLNALAEVENALTAFAEESERVARLAVAAEQSREAAARARDRYRAGLIDFQTVLDTQRSQLGSEDQLVSARAQRAANLVRLVKALGGGPQIAFPESAHE